MTRPPVVPGTTVLLTTMTGLPAVEVGNKFADLPHDRTHCRQVDGAILSRGGTDRDHDHIGFGSCTGEVCTGIESRSGHLLGAARGGPVRTGGFDPD